MNKLIKFLWALVAKKFWGTVMIRFAEGKIVHMDENISHDVSKWE